MRKEFQIQRFLTKEELASGKVDMKIAMTNTYWHRQQRLDLVKKVMATSGDMTLLEDLLQIIGPSSWHMEVL